jgi:hypothetical protein
MTRYPLTLALTSLLCLTTGTAVPTVQAQEATPVPPTVTLGSPRYDAGRNVYLLDTIYTRPEAIGTLQFSVTNEEGVKVAQVDEFPAGRRNQTVEVDAEILEEGQPYQIEVLGFTPGGELILSGQGGAILAAREFVHAPDENLPQLGQPDFVVKTEPPALAIDLQGEDLSGIALFRVILKDSNTNVITLDEQTAGPPPLVVPLANVAAGEYVVEIRALDSGGAALTNTIGEFVYTPLPPPPPPSLGARLLEGLRTNRLIPMAIALIILGVITWLLVRMLAERRTTATPLLPRGQGMGGKAPAPPTVVNGPPTPPRPPPPALALTVTASPDSRLSQQTIRITHYPFRIGRGEGDLDLNGDARVSQRHAEIRYNEHGLVLIDLLSKNGTYLNGERLAAQMPVRLDARATNRISIGGQTHLLLKPAR